MSTIGGISMDIIRGLPQLLKQRVDVWEIPGIDGVGAQTLGAGDSAFELMSVVYVFGDAGMAVTPSAAANTKIDLCTALQGTIVTIVDDWGDSYSTVLVQHVDAKDGKKPCYKLGPTGAIEACVRVELRWGMVTTG